MGGEYRLQGDARLREESDRRPPRILPAIPAEFLKLEIAGDAAIVGVDVGENYLDLASLTPDRYHLRDARVALDRIGGADCIGSLADVLADCVPQLRAGAIAIVD